jgi:hypothetical protein
MTQINNKVGIISKPVMTFLIFILILLNCFALRNFLLLSRDMIFGDFSAQRLVPLPLYSMERIPKNLITLKYDAVNRLGEDFAQIYFPAQDISSLENAYDQRKTLEPWHAASRMAPLIHFICAISICKLSYGYAAFWQLIIQILVFFLALYMAFKMLDSGQYFLPFLLFANLCLFLTPAGLSWFERGQFSLYVGSSYLLLLLGLLRKNLVWILFSALLAFIKWTSLPLIFVILSVYILNSKNLRELQYSLLVAILYAFVFALLLLPFMNTSLIFINGLVSQELSVRTDGLTLATYLPRYLVKALPFLLIIMGYVNARINKNHFMNLITFFGGSAIVLLLYPTLAYEYSVPTLLGLVPCLILWTQKSEHRQYTARISITCLFLCFIVIASFYHYFQSNGLTLIIIYMFFSIAFIASPAILEK